MLIELIAGLEERQPSKRDLNRRRAVSDYVDHRTSADFERYAQEVTSQTRRLLHEGGFSYNAVDQFITFCDMLREMYIFTAREEVIDRQESIVDTENQRVTYVFREVIPQSRIVPINCIQQEEPILLAATRQYQLPAIATRGLSALELRRTLHPNLALVRALKEVINASPVGNAVRAYRRNHPFHKDEGYISPDVIKTGLPASYAITSFETLGALTTRHDSYDTPFIPASDRTSADFFVIANHILYNDRMFGHMSVSSNNDRRRLGSVCPNYSHMEDCSGNPDKDTDDRRYCPRRENCCPTAKKIGLDDIATIPQRFADLFVTAMTNLRVYRSNPERIAKYLHRATGGGVFNRRAPVFDLFSANPHNIISKAHLQGTRYYTPRIRDVQE